MTNRSERLLILGIGNLLLGDEGVGVHAVRRLGRHALPAHVECLDGGTGGLALLEPMQTAARIFLIDAATTNAAPGTVKVLRPRFSKDYPRALTAHDIGLKDLLDGFYLTGRTCDIILYAVSIDPHQTLSLELSAPVAAGAARVEWMILKELGLEPEIEKR